MQYALAWFRQSTLFDTGLELMDEHVEEQLDYGEEDLNASQVVSFPSFRCEQLN